MTSVYLGGNSILDEYRKYCKKKYSKKFKLIDPITNTRNILNKNKRFNLTVDDVKFKSKKISFDKQFCKILCDEDKRLIRSCDILLAYIKKPTFGTVMEIMYANMIGMKVYVINPGLKLSNDIWLKAHTTEFFNSIDSFFNFLTDQKDI